MSTIRSPSKARMLRRVSASTTGPASYNNAARPTITFSGLRTIASVGMVKLWADGYEVEVVSISGNVVTYKVLSGPAHTHPFTASGPLATHQHDLTTITAAGGGVQLRRTAGNTLGAAGTPKTNLNAVDAALAGTPAGTTDAQTRAANTEVINTTNLGAVTFYGEAYGV